MNTHHVASINSFDLWCCLNCDLDFNELLLVLPLHRFYDRQLMVRADW